MVGAEMVVEVLDRPARMAGSVLLEHPFDPVGRHAARGRLVEPSVKQSVQAIVLVAAPVAAEAALAHPQHLRRLQRRQASCLPVPQHILKRLHPAFL